MLKVTYHQWMSASRATTTRARSRPQRAASGGARAPLLPAARGSVRETHAAAATVHDHAVLASVLHPIITINFRGIIQSASNSVYRVFGWTPRELIGRNVSVLMPKAHQSGHNGYLKKYRNTWRTNILNRPRRLEAVRKDGAVVPI